MTELDEVRLQNEILSRRVGMLEALLFSNDPARRDKTVEELLRAEVIRLRSKISVLERNAPSNVSRASEPEIGSGDGTLEMNNLSPHVHVQGYPRDTFVDSAGRISTSEGPGAVERRRT